MVVQWYVSFNCVMKHIIHEILGAGDPRCKVAIVMGVTNPKADRFFNIIH